MYCRNLDNDKKHILAILNSIISRIYNFTYTVFAIHNNNNNNTCIIPMGVDHIVITLIY